MLRSRAGAALIAVIGLLANADSAAAYIGMKAKDAAGCCTIEGSRVEVIITLSSFATTTGEWQALKVTARNSTNDHNVWSGVAHTPGSTMSDQCSGNTVLQKFTRWEVPGTVSCKFWGSAAGSSDHTFKVIRKCASCGDTKWNLYVDTVKEETTGQSIMSSANEIRAGGESSVADSQTVAHSSFGSGTVWQRTARADDQSDLWSDITSADGSFTGGNWTVGTLPSPWFVDDN